MPNRASSRLDSNSDRMLEGRPALSAHAMASCCSSGGGGVFAGTTAGGEAFAAMTLDELTGGGATGSHDGIGSSGTTTSPGAACADVEVNESYLPLLTCAGPRSRTREGPVGCGAARAG
jgi:hypothetical protein